MTARLPGSFRDPAGHIYVSDNIIYRRIEPAGRDAYAALMQSGLYQALLDDQLIVPHDDLGAQPDQPGALTVIRPERIPMISYPYEWSFSQLRDAALLTLRVQRRAIEFGQSLKDASAFNVQFLRGRPVLIDTLSFEPLRPGPWFAYRQFCQHFYAPLLLISLVDVQLGRLSQSFIDGVPLTVASKLLPKSTWLKPGPLMHIHLHAKAEQKWSAPPGDRGQGGEGPATKRRQATGSPQVIVESLERAIAALTWQPRSNWASYYADQPSYEDAALARKREVVGRWLQHLKPGTVWDFGANTGQFSAMAVDAGANTVAFDGDPACVELMYQGARNGKTDRLLPLVADLSAPSPAIGWGNAERMTIEQRGPADLLLALALVHHLAIGNNVPFPEIASYFSRVTRRAAVEFVPRGDAMVRHMLAGRDDVFADYTRERFEQAFSRHFSIDEQIELAPSERVLYLMTAR